MTPSQKAQAPILGRRVLKGIPETDGTRRVGVEEGAVLVRRDGATDLRLLTNNHGLQTLRLFELERAGNGGGRMGGGGREKSGEGRREGMQVVADFVNGFGLVFYEFPSGVKGI